MINPLLVEFIVCINHITKKIGANIAKYHPLIVKTMVMVKNTKNILFACVWSGVIFFILSNFGMWLTGAYYPKTFNGLIACYAAAIPFYKNEFFGNMLLNTFMSNLFFTALLFGAYALIKKTVFSANTQLAG